MSATSWNITIDDPSPVLSYSPSSESGSIADGWTTHVPQLGFDNATGGEHGGVQHAARHCVPRRERARLQFYGTVPLCTPGILFWHTRARWRDAASTGAGAVVLNGHAYCSYTGTLDNEPQNLDSAPSSDGTLFVSGDLTAGTRFVTLTAQSNSSGQQLAFDGAVVSIPVDASGTPPTPVVSENWNSTVSYQGSWSSARDPEIPSPSDPQPSQTSTTKGDTVSLAFSRASAIAIDASINYGHGLYFVKLDGVDTNYNGSALWLIPNTYLFFQAGLDPTQMHTINLTNNLFGTGNKLTFSSFTVYQANQTGILWLAQDLTCRRNSRRRCWWCRRSRSFARVLLVVAARWAPIQCPHTSPLAPPPEGRDPHSALRAHAARSGHRCLDHPCLVHGPERVRAGRRQRWPRPCARRARGGTHTGSEPVTLSFDPPSSLSSPPASVDAPMRGGSDAPNQSDEVLPPLSRLLHAQNAQATQQAAAAHPDEVANRILEIISSRIDMPSRQSQPPQYEA